MAWRIGESIVRGEIDNRIPGIIKGALYLEGLNEPITLELEGDCDPDLAGRRLTFRNLLPCANKSLEALGRIQCGEPGTFTARRMVRIPTISKEELDRCLKEEKPIPTRWSESLFLEWFGTNGRVLIEGSSFTCELSPAKWKRSEETHQWLCRLRERSVWSPPDVADETSGDSEEWEENRGAAEHPFGFSVQTVDGLEPDPLVRRTSEFLLRMIFENKSRKYFTDDALEVGRWKPHWGHEAALGSHLDI